MAIQIDLSNSHYGIPFIGAYFRITTAAVVRTRNTENRHIALIDVSGYAAPPTDEDTREVDFRRYHVPIVDVESMSGSTFLAKCYAWVMSQSDMYNSVGV